MGDIGGEKVAESVGSLGENNGSVVLSEGQESSKLDEGSKSSVGSITGSNPSVTAPPKAGTVEAGASVDDDTLTLDKTITRFRFQYDKLHRSLARSMENERKLVQSTKNLRMKLVDNSKKIELAYKWKSEDQKTIKLLRRELQKSWEVAETYRQKELRAQELIQHLQDEIASLSEHAHTTLSNANNTVAVASVVSRAESSGKSVEKMTLAAPKFSGSQRGRVPSFADWKRNHYNPNSSLASSRLGVVTPNAGDRRKGTLLNSEGGSPFRKNRPKTTPMKSRPRTPLEYATQRS